jgi:hypothetical protein
MQKKRLRAFLKRENASLTLIQIRCIEAKIKTNSFLYKKWTFLEFFEFSSKLNVVQNSHDCFPPYNHAEMHSKSIKGGPYCIDNKCSVCTGWPKKVAFFDILGPGNLLF